MASAGIQPPYFPIIFVPGYAATETVVEEVVASPYMGFNQGSTKIRQRWTGAIEPHVFESPLVRLHKDWQYGDAYRHGAEIAGAPVPARTVFIYRYYDEASRQLGTGERHEIEKYARSLGEFALRIRDQVCGGDPEARRIFRVYLVAHSMGGLICRCLLQNPSIGPPEARSLVDKVFTYSTPHNGIDLNILGNVPGFSWFNESDTFNRERMAEYLDLPRGEDRVDSLNGRFDPERFFCLVGTAYRDYAEAAGLVRRLVGPMSDGLVRIENATVRNAPRAFVHRSHGGDFGIVNSEEGYQNLVRFLFGDARADGVLRIHAITLPPVVQRAKDRGRSVRASYHFEVVVRVRGAAWDLHRRTVAEASAIFRTYDDLFPREEAKAARDAHLFSAFLCDRCRVPERRATLGFSVDLGVLVPEYEIDGALWLDDYHEGGYLFREKFNFEMCAPAKGRPWVLRYGLDSVTPNRTSRRLDGPAAGAAGTALFYLPVRRRTRPGIDGTLELRIRPWNVAG